MLFRSSKRAPLVAMVSFVLALGAAVGPGEGVAFAQRAKKPAPRTAPDSAETADGEEASEDAAQKAEEEKKKAEEAEAARKAEEAKEEEHQKELDLSKEQPKAVYLSADLAFTRSDLGAISDNTGLDRTVANGFLYGLSAGLRLKDIRVGARWRVYDTTDFTLWTVALSAGYGLPLRPVSPVFSAHVGYVFDQHIEEALFRSSLPQGSVLPPDVSVKGLLVGVDVNASYWVTQFLRLGVFVGADLMFLTRSQAAIPQSIFGPEPSTAALPLYSGSGSGLGLNMNAGLRGAFDIGFK